MSDPRKILTGYDGPFGYYACREDDEEGGYGDDGRQHAPNAIFGHGKTEEEAIADLKEQENEK
jgi:predicted RNase H-like HicB family nuclease